jgi:hypothetical protein
MRKIKKGPVKHQTKPGVAKQKEPVKKVITKKEIAAEPEPQPEKEFNGYKVPTLEIFTKIAKKKGGNLTEIASALNVSRRAVTNWMNELPEYREVVDDVKESLLDLSESNMVQLIKGIPEIAVDENGNKVFAGWKQRPSETLIIFHLKTKGKDRGYIERQEIEHDAGGSFLEFLQKSSL